MTKKYRNQVRTAAFMGGLLALLLLAACSQEETMPQDTSLPEGKYPLVLTAGGLEVTATPDKAGTRATVDNTWNKGDSVAVHVRKTTWESYGVKKYSVDASGKLISDDPFYWQESGVRVCVDSWYPYRGETSWSFTWNVKTETDQSALKDYQASDFLFAYTWDIQFAGWKKGVTLNYKHLTSKVVFNILSSNYLTEFKPNGISVSLKNFCTEGNFSYLNEYGTMIDPHIDGIDNSKGTITPHELDSPTSGVYASYAAIVVPQNENGQYIKVKVGDATYKWDLSGITSLEGGKVYTFNITVKENKLDVTVGNSMTWTVSSSSGSGSVTLN